MADTILTIAFWVINGEGIEGAARDHLGRQDLRDYIAQASQSLSTRIELTDEQVTIVAEAVTALKAAIPGLATADALQALRTVVTQQGDSISANSTWLTSLQAGLDNLTTVVGGKASSSALNALTARVSDAEGDISTQAGQITSLQSGLTTTNNTVATKASTTALNALTTRVNAAEGNITSQADAQTTLNASVNQFAASGLFRIGVEATPSGALSRIGLKASATAAEATSARSAAMFMEAIPGGKSRVAFVADQFVIQQAGVSYLPFIVDGGVVYLNSARIAGNTITQDVVINRNEQVQGSGYTSPSDPWITYHTLTVASASAAIQSITVDAMVTMNYSGALSDLSNASQLWSARIIRVDTGVELYSTQSWAFQPTLLLRGTTQGLPAGTYQFAFQFRAKTTLGISNASIAAFIRRK